MNVRPSTHTLTLTVTMLLAVSSAVCATEPPAWKDAQRLLESGNAAEALELLLLEESSLIGKPDYDYLLAKAYLANGDWQLALFALERVLILKPDHAAARLMAARIHAEQGISDWAARELSQLSRESLVPRMRREMDTISALIAAPPATVPKRLRYRASISGGFGYDSNVTYGPDADSLWIPSQASISDLGDSSAEDDLYLLLAGNGQFEYSLNSDTALTGSVGISRKLNQERGDVNEDYLNLALGISQKVGKDILGIKGLFESYWVDDDVYRWYWGMQADWRHPLKDGSWLSGIAQYAEYTYPDDASYDAARTVAGLYHWKPFSINGQDASVRYGFHFGNMDAANSDSEYTGYNLWGARLDLTYQPTSTLTLAAGVVFEQRDHKNQDVLYETGREDNQWTATLSATYALDKKWNLIASAGYSDNGSNLALYDYDRTVVQLTLKREFGNE